VPPPCGANELFSLLFFSPARRQGPGVGARTLSPDTSSASTERAAASDFFVQLLFSVQLSSRSSIARWSAGGTAARNLRQLVGRRCRFRRGAARSTPGRARSGAEEPEPLGPDASTARLTHPEATSVDVSTPSIIFIQVVATNFRFCDYVHTQMK
jgi:hypothetical protein